MAIVEYRPGLDFGVGVDSLDGGIRGDAVVLTPQMEPSQAQELHLVLRQVESQQDLEKELGFSAEFSASFSFFGGDAKFSLAEKSKFSQYAIYLVVHALVGNSYQQMRNVKFEEEAIALLKNGQSALFRERFGDQFVRGKQTGGELSAILEILYTDKSDLEEVKAQLRAGGWGFSVDSSLTTSIQEVSRTHTINLYWDQKGGKLEASVDPATIVNKARTFADEVSEHSAVYSLLLVDYKTLPAPEGASWVDVQAAKETLVHSQATCSGMER